MIASAVIVLGLMSNLEGHVKKFGAGLLAIPLMSVVVAPTASASGYNDIYNSAAEYAACIKVVGVSGPYRCVQARNHANVAASAAASIYRNSLHNGKGDAFRHCYWNARMTKDFGSSLAYKIATNHENVSSGPARERAMDLANNLEGRKVGMKARSMTAAYNMCKWRADTGRLKTL